MERRRTTFFVALVVALLVASLGLAGNAVAGVEKPHGGKPLTATLTGDAEVPGPGDDDGTGTARVTLNPGQRQVCWEIEVENIAPATRAHIHQGAAGVAGGIVVSFFEPDTSGMLSGCTEDVDRDLIKDIIQNPENYYVNVHNAEFLAGAIRGQLG